MGACTSQPTAAGVGTSHFGNTAEVSLEPLPPKMILSREPSRNNSTVDEGEKYKGIQVGLKLLCLDSFVSKYTQETMYKWRNAVVRVYDGSKKTCKMLVHYEGWSVKYDKWVDIESPEVKQLCPLGVMSQKQEESGGALTVNQQMITKMFFVTGQLTDPEDKESMIARGLMAPDSPLTLDDPEGEGPQVNFYKGLKIDVQDVFQRAGEKTLSKWRVAEVLEMSASKLRVHYLGLGHEFDEVLDLNKDMHRVRERGQLSNINGMRKSRSLGTSSSRLQRRSFDSVHTPSSPTTTNVTQEKYFESLASELDNDVQGSSSSLKWKINGDDSMGEEDSSPAFLLRNKEAPINTHSKRNLSFSSKPGHLVLGAVAGFTPPRLPRRHSNTGIEVGRRATTELAFSDRMENIGLHIVEIEPDGNCLFRALSHQLYCTEDRHADFRRMCVQHMLLHRDRFEIFCTSDFDSYCRRMSMDGTWASELEIRALEEITDRLFSIYSSDTKDVKPMPMATNFDEALLLGMSVSMVKLTYHGNHYNSVFDQKTSFPLGERNSGHQLLNSRVKLFKGGK